MKDIENSKNFDYSDCNFENYKNVENIIINNDLNSIKINLFLKSLCEIFILIKKYILPLKIIHRETIDYLKNILLYFE